jgi:putative transposase
MEEDIVVPTQRHTDAEIAAKLAMADEMAAQGRLHGDIAKSLGVSVMTYHRWRKARATSGHPSQRNANDAERMEIPIEREQTGKIRELQVENLRLRRLVTDLLLQKMEIEEGLRGGAAIHKAAGRS